MNLITPDTRVAILARMVLAAPEQTLGRTQIMKLCYFLQEMKGIPLGYDFRLFNYGPFDSEVLSDLSSACGLDIVDEKTVLYSRGYGYSITPGNRADRQSRGLEDNDAALAAEVDRIVQELGGFGAAELELRSTVLFVDREWSQAGNATTEQQLVERVREIKPHFPESTIRERVQEMAAKAWLNSLGI